MNHVLELLNVDLARIKELAQKNDFTIIRANPSIEHVFSELYTVPEQIRYGYIRVKVLELLLILTGLETIKDKAKAHAFPEAQIEVIKQVHGLYAKLVELQTESANWQLNK